MRTKNRQFIWLVMFAILAGCGPKINKQLFGPEEYFEYAKKKFDEEDYFDAATEFTVIVLKYSGHPIVDDAQFYLAESRYGLKEYLIAIAEYEKLINDYPESPYVPRANFKIAMCYYRLSSRPELDQEYTLKAHRYFQQFIEEYPKHELRAEAEKMIQEMRNKLAYKKYLAATTYRKMGVCNAAIIYYDIILENYYDASVAADALYWKGICLFRLKKYLDARTVLSTFVEKFPSHKYSDKAKQRISQITELLASSDTQKSQSSKNDAPK